MQVVSHDDATFEERFPGVTRAMMLDKATGTGGICCGVVHLEPGATIFPHTHLVEEVMTLTEGELLVLVGTETQKVSAPASFFAPANIVHGARNIGGGRATLVIAYPSVEVGATRVDVEF